MVKLIGLILFFHELPIGAWFIEWPDHTGQLFQKTVMAAWPLKLNDQWKIVRSNGPVLFTANTRTMVISGSGPILPLNHELVIADRAHSGSVLDDRLTGISQLIQSGSNGCCHG